MKFKKIFVLISLGILITGVALFASKDSTSGRNPKSSDNNKLSQNEIEKNAKLYQPQIGGKTLEVDLGINAQSAIVFDQETGEILYQKDCHTRLAPASIAKVATYSVAVENFDIEELIEISQTAADQEPNKIVMKAGEKMHFKDLLYGLMMISANDAAYAIAEAYPGGFNSFIARMNEFGRELGLSNTNFENPSGLDGDNYYSSAFDIATFTRYALTKHPEILKYMGEKNDYSVYPSEHNESHWWAHISSMLYRYPGMLGVKTGYTDIANSTFVGAAERNGRTLVVIFLNSRDANGDVAKLFDHGFSY